MIIDRHHKCQEQYRTWNLAGMCDKIPMVAENSTTNLRPSTVLILVASIRTKLRSMHLFRQNVRCVQKTTAKKNTVDAKKICHNKKQPKKIKQQA